MKYQWISIKKPVDMWNDFNGNPLEIQIKFKRNFNEIPMEIHWKSSRNLNEIPIKIYQKSSWNVNEIPMEIHYKSSWNFLEHQCYPLEIQLNNQWNDNWNLMEIQFEFQWNTNWNPLEMKVNFIRNFNEIVRFPPRNWRRWGGAELAGFNLGRVGPATLQATKIACAQWDIKLKFQWIFIGHFIEIPIKIYWKSS